MPYVVYSLQSESSPEHYYVGFTTDLDARLLQHNSPGEKHTSKYQPWAVVVAVHFADEGKARQFEKYLKTGSGRAFSKKHF